MKDFWNWLPSFWKGVLFITGLSVAGALIGLGINYLKRLLLKWNDNDKKTKL